MYNFVDRRVSVCIMLYVWCDMDDEYESINLFAFYEPYELMVGLFLPGHHMVNLIILP